MTDHIVMEHVFAVLAGTIIFSILFVFPISASADGTVTRTIITGTAETDELVTIVLTVTPSATDRYVLIEEIIPSEFIIPDAGGGSTTQPNTVKWAAFDTNPIEPTTFTYKITTTQAGSYLIGGQYYFEGSSTPIIITGDDTITIEEATNTAPSSGSSGGGGGGGGAIPLPDPETVEEEAKQEVDAQIEEEFEEEIIVEETIEEQVEEIIPTPQPEETIDPGAITGLVSLNQEEEETNPIVAVAIFAFIILGITGTTIMHKKHIHLHLPKHQNLFENKELDIQETKQPELPNFK